MTKRVVWAKPVACRIDLKSQCGMNYPHPCSHQKDMHLQKGIKPTAGCCIAAQSQPVRMLDQMRRGFQVTETISSHLKLVQ